MDDPIVRDWPQVELPKTWPDEIKLPSIKGFLKLFKHIFARRSPVQLPTTLIQEYQLPKYLLQEFHNLPNGNYSQNFSRGYITGFEYSMLGSMEKIREEISDYLSASGSVLDIGCAGGKTAAAIQAKTQQEVWGLDPSPYLIKHAAMDHSTVKFITGLAEDLPFASERFDSISVCFVFHELSPRYITLALKEINRVLKPNGRLIIVEPSESQLENSYWRLFSENGLKGGYFKWLANRVHEPFVQSWHKYASSIESHLESTGLKLEQNIERYPARFFYCHKH